MPIMPQIEHIVVVMLENRSFDNMCGWLYRDGPPPNQFLPVSTKNKTFNGLHQGLFNPVSNDYFKGQPSPPPYPIFPNANALNMPNVKGLISFNGGIKTSVIYAACSSCVGGGCRHK